MVDKDKAWSWVQINLFKENCAQKSYRWLDEAVILCLFVCNRGDTESQWSPIKVVRPSPYATGVPNS